jgi:actin related protein 2/3 complex subunit 3
MPPYHSAYNKDNAKIIGGLPILPLKGQNRGIAPVFTEGDKMDIVDEALYYFRANVLFKNYEIQGISFFFCILLVEGPGDKLLMYLTLFISQCLTTVQKQQDEANAKKELVCWLKKIKFFVV